jgi:hypothetical protein
LLASLAASQPKAAVVVVGSKGLNPKEVELVLQTALDEMRASSGFVLDSGASLAVSGEATMLGCALERDCLLRAGEEAHVDAVVGLRATLEGKKVAFELLWVASDARGLSAENKVLLARTLVALEAGVRDGVRKAIPDYARKGLGALTVLAEAGAEIQVDGRVAGTAPMAAPLVLSAGIHQVEVVTPTHQRVTRSAEVLEARKAQVDIASPNEAIAALIAPAPEQKVKVLRNASFVVGGVAVVALGGGLYFGAQTLSLNGQIRGGQCKATPCPAGMTQDQANKLSQQASGQAVLANAGVASGVLLGLGAGLMYYLGSREDP